MTISVLFSFGFASHSILFFCHSIHCSVSPTYYLGLVSIFVGLAIDMVSHLHRILLNLNNYGLSNKIDIGNESAKPKVTRPNKKKNEMLIKLDTESTTWSDFICASYPS